MEWVSHRRASGAHALPVHVFEGAGRGEGGVWVEWVECRWASTAEGPERGDGDGGRCG